MTERRLVLVPTLEDAPAPDPAATVIVLDTAWTPTAGSRSDVLPVRPFISDVLRRTDLFIESCERLDAWADAVGLPDRLTVGPVSWWYRRRIGYWLWLHERLLWRPVLDACLVAAGSAGSTGPSGSSDVGGPVEAIDVRADLPALADVAKLVGARDGVDVRLPALAEAEPEETDRTPSSPGFLRRLVTAPGRRARRRELLRRSALLGRRVDDLAGASAPRLLYLTNPLVHQVVGTGDGPRVDPFLGSVADRLEDGGVEPIVLDLGADARDDGAWPALERDAGRLPATLLATRWEDAADRESAAIAAAGVADSLGDLPAVPLDDGGIDLGPLLLADIRRFAGNALQARVREARRVERMLGELHPAGLMLVNEYGRTEWLAGAAAAAVPSFAVQHGVIYPWHLGYRHPRRSGLPYADRTFLFGDYERRVLLDVGGYRPDEVVVSGAPRLDLAKATAAGDTGSERAAVRREIGVRDGDRLLVISTTFERLHRRYYWMHALAAVLDVELPRVHLVFKQHPAEADEGPYRALVEGLAAAAGRAAPPIAVVRDTDLYRLLRAADAHLGLFSTVLTDAVATGTPNLIAVTQAHRDLLGYVEAGVAVGVRDGAELLAALDRPTPVDAAARAAFLDDHFRPGEASARIRDAVLEVVASSGRPASTRSAVAATSAA